MGCVLFGVEGYAVESAAGAHPRGHGRLQVGDQRPGFRAGEVQEVGKVGQDEAHRVGL